MAPIAITKLYGFSNYPFLSTISANPWPTQVLYIIISRFASWGGNSSFVEKLRHNTGNTVTCF